MVMFQAAKTLEATIISPNPRTRQLIVVYRDLNIVHPANQRLQSKGRTLFSMDNILETAFRSLLLENTLLPLVTNSDRCQCKCHQLLRIYF